MEQQPETRYGRRRRVVLVPAPYQGHLNPMLSLGYILHSRGFSITVAYINCNSPNPSNHPEFQFLQIPFDSSKLLQICDAKYIRFMLMMGEHCEAPLVECLSQLKETADEKISCVIHDEYMIFSSTAASRLELPSIAFTTSSATTFLSRLSLLHINIEETDSEELVPDIPYPIRFKDLPTNVFGTPDELLKLVVSSKNTRNSSAVIFNTMEFLEGASLAKIREKTGIPIFPIGPMHIMAFASASNSSLLEEDWSCISWLDKQANNSVLYVSPGSIAGVEENEVAEIAWGLANSHQPFVWVIRPGSIKGADWIEKLPEDMMKSVGERGCFLKWAPQKEVLAHPAVGGFWSHCGWNSTMESLYEGVPMICRPGFGDQTVNSRCLSFVWNVGLELRGNLGRDEVETAVKRLMVEDEGKEMRKKALQIKDEIKNCIREDGSYNKSLNVLEDLLMSI